MTAEQPNHQSFHQWHRGYLIQAILLALLVAGAFGGRFWLVHLDYVGGLHNRFWNGFEVALLFYPMLALISVILAIHAVIRVFSLPRSFRHVLLRVGFLAVIPAVFAGSLLVAVPGQSDAFERGYEKWILRNVDIESIQQWLAAEGHKYKGHNSGGREYNFPKELPGFFTDFEPQYTFFYDSAAQGGPYVKFEWGGPPAHWGFIIGLPTMPMPLKGTIQLTRSLVGHRYPIKPGVYIFIEG